MAFAHVSPAELGGRAPAIGSRYRRRARYAVGSSTVMLVFV